MSSYLYLSALLCNKHVCLDLKALRDCLCIPSWDSINHCPFKNYTHYCTAIKKRKKLSVAILGSGTVVANKKKKRLKKFYSKKKKVLF